MYDELVKRLRDAARYADKGLVIMPSICLEAADALEKLSISLIEIISTAFPEIILDVISKDGRGQVIENYCKTCRHYDDIGFCDKCFYDHIFDEKGIPPTEYEEKPKPQPQTNADRIRAMTDEELAKYLDGVCHDLWQMFVKDPKKMWLDWLKEEAKDER